MSVTFAGLSIVGFATLFTASPKAAAEEEHYAEYGLTLTLPELEKLEPAPSGDQVLGAWQGEWRGSTVSIDLVALGAEKYRLDEPEDLSDLLAGHYAENPRRSSVFRFGSVHTIAGDYGCVPYASLLEGAWIEKGTTRAVSSAFALCGLTERAGWALEVVVEPPLQGEDARFLVDWAKKSLRYEGARRDPKWTEEEVRARWERDVPDAEKTELEDVIRTAHYIVFTSSSGGKLFAKKMEECYEKIQAIFPFDEVPGRKLMPVFLFRTPDEYFAFYAKLTGKSLEDARKSKGHAWRDYYATWYEAPNDPVHVHEATHQIFANRLRLSGGGSWFQEGVAEYVETRDNDRNAVAREIAKGRGTPLRELMQLKSLLYSSEDDAKGGSKASDHYTEAALLIEFLRESKFGKERFMDFVHEVGAVPRSDLSAIEAVLQSVYGVTIDELNERFVAYCKKR